MRNWLFAALGGVALLAGCATPGRPPGILDDDVQARATSLLVPIPVTSTRPLYIDLTWGGSTGGPSFPKNDLQSNSFLMKVSVECGGDLEETHPCDFFALFGPYRDYELLAPNDPAHEEFGGAELRCSAPLIWLASGWVLVSGEHPLVSTDWTEVETPEGLTEGSATFVVRMDRRNGFDYVYNHGMEEILIKTNNTTDDGMTLPANHWVRVRNDGSIDGPHPQASSQPFVRFAKCMGDYSMGLQGTCPR